MGDMDDIDRDGDPLTLASRWMARLQSDDADEADMAALADWRAADPSHEAAWSRLTGIWDATAQIKNDPAIVALRQSALTITTPAAQLRQTGGWKWLALAASLTLAIGVSTTLWSSGWFSGSNASGPVLVERELRTGVGQLATTKLDDGSAVTLDTDTILRVDDWRDGERRLTLVKGQAFFEVAKDKAHPFVVHAPGAVVTAVGTAFAIRQQGPRFHLIMTEGRVLVQPASTGTAGSGEPLAVDAGMQLELLEGRTTAFGSIDASRATSWRTGRISFDRSSLRDAVAEMNRYSTRQIIVADQRLAATPVSGTFRTGSVDDFVAVLDASGIAAIGDRTTQGITLVPGKGSQKP